MKIIIQNNGRIEIQLQAIVFLKSLFYPSRKRQTHILLAFSFLLETDCIFFFINSKCLSPPFHVGGSSFSLNNQGECAAAGSTKNRLFACGLAGVEFAASIEPFIFHWSLLLQLHKRLGFRVIYDQVLTLQVNNACRNTQLESTTSDSTKQNQDPSKWKHQHKFDKLMETWN